ncbi:MAG: CooT family nickel-binding protein [Dehalococcoidia bacterium]
MCLAKAYVGETEPGNLMLEDVAWLQIEGTRINLTTLFGERKEINGRLREVDFQGSKIVIDRVN